MEDVSYARTKDGLFAGKFDGYAMAMVIGPEGHYARRTDRRPPYDLEQMTVADFQGFVSMVDDEDGFVDFMQRWRGHVIQFEALAVTMGRSQTLELKTIADGRQSTMTTVYTPGFVCYSPFEGSHYVLDAAQNALVPEDVRSEDGIYEGIDAVAMCLVRRELLTDYEVEGLETLMSSLEKVEEPDVDDREAMAAPGI